MYWKGEHKWAQNETGLFKEIFPCKHFNPIKEFISVAATIQLRSCYTVPERLNSHCDSVTLAEEWPKIIQDVATWTHQSWQSVQQCKTDNQARTISRTCMRQVSLKPPDAYKKFLQDLQDVKHFPKTLRRCDELPKDPQYVTFAEVPIKTMKPVVDHT